MVRTVLVSTMFAASVALAAQHTGSAPAEPPPQSRIIGTVVGAESGRGVRLAQVTLFSDAGEMTQVTDDSGAFAFERLRPGDYRLTVSKPGYLETRYGQTRLGTDTAGRRIRLVERDQVEKISVPLSQGASVSGVVRDIHGDPVYRATVRVSRWVIRNGARTLEEVASADTDERGAYRIPLLPPRNYVVSATPGEAVVDERAPNPQGFAHVFHPGSASPAGAETIALSLGDERSIDLHLPLVPLTRITGVVLDANGVPAPDIAVSLDDVGLSGAGGEQGVNTDERGRFEFKTVAPGSYIVSAGNRADFHVSADTITLDIKGDVSFGIASKWKAANLFSVLSHVDERGRSVSSHASAGSASAEISVINAPLPDVVLRLEAPRIVSGRLLFEGSAAQSPRDIQVVLAPLGTGHMMSDKVNPDGTFAIQDLAPGRYAVSIDGSTGPWTLARAMSGGVDVLDELLEVPRDREVNDLTLTLRDRASELSGTVFDSAAQPADDRVVVVFSANERLWATALDRVQATPVGPDGRYVFTDLRPGAYRLAVVAGVEPEEWLDPAFLRQLLPVSVPITLGDAEKKTQDLRVK